MLQIFFAVARRVAAEAEQRLLSNCRRIIEHAATEAWAVHEAVSSGVSNGSRAATISEGAHWDAAIHAPLVIASLAGYKMVSEEARRNELREIYPQLAKLVCSEQPTVRAALGEMMGTLMAVK